MKYLLLLSVVISGCGFTPAKIEIVKTEYLVAEIPDSLLTDCHVSAPPDRNEYPAGTFSEKEEALINYSLSLLGDISTCNSQLSQIRDILTTQQSVLESQDTKHE